MFGMSSKGVLVSIGSVSFMALAKEMFRLSMPLTKTKPLAIAQEQSYLLNMILNRMN